MCAIIDGPPDTEKVPATDTDCYQVKESEPDQFVVFASDDSKKYVVAYPERRYQESKKQKSST